jgi:site-specific DNA-methyltransferase (adenine-specific)
MNTYTTNLLDLRCMDCMDLMRGMPDKAFELAIVDPPYGVKRLNRPGIMKHLEGVEGWNTPPTVEYFQELLRVSKNTIIWGYNYFSLPPCSHFIFWDKLDAAPSFSAGELAWTSFSGSAVKWRSAIPKDKIHPCQKPTELYRWLLHNYAKPGDRILDTHLGSASSAIACHYKGYHLTGTELDPDYFAAAVKRVQAETAQQELAL